jgi:Flp pilus assembly protein TadD
MLKSTVKFWIVSLAACALSFGATHCFASDDDAGKCYKNGEVLIQKVRYLDALHEFDKAVAANPQFAPAYSGRAQVLNILGDFSGAFKAASRSIVLDPKYGPAYANRSVSLYFLGQGQKSMDDALICKKLGSAEFPVDATCVPMAAACLGLGRFEDALGWCNKAITLNPKLQSAYALRANIELKQARYKEALDDCNKAVALFQRSPRAYEHRAIAYEQLGQHDFAKSDRQQAKRIFDENAAILAEYKKDLASKSK